MDLQKEPKGSLSTLHIAIILISRTALLVHLCSILEITFPSSLTKIILLAQLACIDQVAFIILIITLTGFDWTA